MKKLIGLLALIASVSGGGALRAQGIIAPGHVMGNGASIPHTATDAPLFSVFDQNFSGVGLIERAGSGSYPVLSGVSEGDVLIDQGPNALPIFATISGDATLAANGVLTLASSGVTAGTYGDATHVAQVTFDAKGRATSASSVTITHASGDLAAANNLSDVASASTSRTNLGLGTAATQNTGTSGATVPLLNGNNTESGNNTHSGTENFTGPFQIGGTAQTFPATGILVGTTDAQTLTNKSIDGSEIATGTVASARLPVATTGAVGAVKPDGTTITVDGNGTISALGLMSSVFSCMTPTQIADVQAGTLTQDVTSAITTCKASHSQLFYPAGKYRVSAPLHFSNGHDEGAGQHVTTFVSYDSTLTDPIVYAGTAEVMENIGFSYNTVAGTETLGQKVGVATYDPNTFPLQRGSTLRNLFFSNVGTCIYDPANESMFSVTMHSIECQNWSYRGIDIEGSEQTGSVLSNIYINNYNGTAGTPLWSTNATVGLVLGNCGGTPPYNVSEFSLDQINVEWAELGAAVNFCGDTAVHVGTMHFEEIALRNAFSGLMNWKNSSIKIDDLSVYYPPIINSGWYIAQIFDSANLSVGSGSEPNNVGYFEIGTLNLLGLNDGLLVQNVYHDTPGLSGLTDFFLFDRETSAVGPATLKVDNYIWNTFETDSSVYSTAPTDPHQMILILPTPNGFQYPPIASSCGTSPTVIAGSTIYTGAVTVGTGGTACTLTFPGTGYHNQALGTVVDEAGSVPPYSISKTGITISAATAGHTYAWSVNGN